MPKRLAELIAGCSNVVFFGGAGVSTESGIPDFRSAGGVYSKIGDVAPERALSHDFFLEYPEQFYQYHRTHLLHLDARPNDAHRALARLEETGKLKAVITQNVDGLHQQAGSRAVLELHGSALRNYCLNCKARYDALYVQNYPQTVVRCEKCGGLVRPDVVLYDEFLDQGVMERTVRAIADADLLIVGGTSLTVYPAAGFVQAFTGGHLVLINRTATPWDDKAELIYREPIGRVLKMAVEKWEEMRHG